MGGKKRVWVTRIGLLVSIVFLYLFLKDIEFLATWEALKQANYLWLIPSFIAGYSGLLTRAFRWRVFLGQEHRGIRISRLFNTLTVGFFGNTVLPARAGEFLRAYMLMRAEPVRFSMAFATVVVERVFDLFALIVSMVLLFVIAPFPPELKDSNPGLIDTLQRGGCLIAAATFSMAAFLWAMVRLPKQCHRILLRLTFWLPEKIQQRLLGSLESFVGGLGIFRDLGATVKALAWTVAVWFSILLTEYFTILAFGFDVSLLNTMVLMVTLAFAVALPQAPGYLGPFQWATSMTLVAFYAVASAPAKAFAIVLWFAQLLPIFLLGLVCLHLEGLTLKQMWRSVKAHEKEEEEESPPAQ